MILYHWYLTFLFVIQAKYGPQYYENKQHKKGKKHGKKNKQQAYGVVSMVQFQELTEEYGLYKGECNLSSKCLSTLVYKLWNLF